MDDVYYMYEKVWFFLVNQFFQKVHINYQMNNSLIQNYFKPIHVKYVVLMCLVNARMCSYVH